MTTRGLAVAMLLSLGLALAPGLAFQSRAEEPAKSPGADVRNTFRFTRRAPQVLRPPSGVSVDLRGSVAYLSDGKSYTCTCDGLSCESSCKSKRDGSTLTCSGTCKNHEEFYGCIREGTCGWHEGKSSVGLRPRGSSGTLAPVPDAPKDSPPVAPREMKIQTR
jgi:hypothetical protein